MTQITLNMDFLREALVLVNKLHQACVIPLADDRPESIAEALLQIRAKSATVAESRRGMSELVMLAQIHLNQVRQRYNNLFEEGSNSNQVKFGGGAADERKRKAETYARERIGTDLDEAEEMLLYAKQALSVTAAAEGCLSDARQDLNLLIQLMRTRVNLAS